LRPDGSSGKTLAEHHDHNGTRPSTAGVSS
jgi:hypothetical protein